MSADPLTEEPELPPSKRRRGRKPADADRRRDAVLHALSQLEASRTPFSMSDLAERAGISRATLYRDANLRDLVGKIGDGPPTRPIRFSDYEKQKAERDALVAERRALRRQLRDRDVTIADLQREVADLEENVELYARRARQQAAQDVDTIRRDAYAEGFAQGVRTAMGQRGGTGAAAGARRPGAGPLPGPVPGGLVSVAAKLPKPTLLAARRNLARVLHPDLFAGDDPATAALATELLKQINALAAEPAEAKKT